MVMVGLRVWLEFVVSVAGCFGIGCVFRLVGCFELRMLVTGGFSMGCYSIGLVCGGITRGWADLVCWQVLVVCASGSVVSL